MLCDRVTIDTEAMSQFESGLAALVLLDQLSLFGAAQPCDSCDIPAWPCRSAGGLACFCRAGPHPSGLRSQREYFGLNALYEGPLFGHLRVVVRTRLRRAPHPEQSTATSRAVQMARICVSASRPSRFTNTPTESLSFESRFTAERRGIGSEPGSRTISLASPRMIVVQCGYISITAWLSSEPSPSGCPMCQTRPSAGHRPGTTVRADRIDGRGGPGSRTPCADRSTGAVVARRSTIGRSPGDIGWPGRTG